MTPEVRTESVNIIEERLSLLETELLLVQAASKDDSFPAEDVRAWALRLLPVLQDLREWSHFLKEAQ